MTTIKLGQEISLKYDDCELIFHINYIKKTGRRGYSMIFDKDDEVVLELKVSPPFKVNVNCFGDYQETFHGKIDKYINTKWTFGGEKMPKIMTIGSDRSNFIRYAKLPVFWKTVTIGDRELTIT